MFSALRPNTAAMHSVVSVEHLTEKINNPSLRAARLTFRQIAEHYINNDLLNPDVIKDKAETTKDCYKHVIRAYLIERWGSKVAVEISPVEVEDWLEAISIDKDPTGLARPTLSKMRNIMSLIYAHAQRKKLILDDVKYNLVRPPELGGARCKCESDYAAVILAPRQTFQILNSLPLLQQTMVVLGRHKSSSLDCPDNRCWLMGTIWLSEFTRE